MTDDDAPVSHLSGPNWVEPSYLPRGPWTYDAMDPAIMLFTASVQRFGMRFPSTCQILEVGCAETDWLERMAKWDPSLRLVGVDQNRQVRPETGFQLIQADGLDPNLFPAESFDWIVMLGALEHFGLGFYGDSLDDDGDVVMLQNMQKWLRPHGLCYFDVPAQPTFSITENRHFRMYSPAALTERIVASGLHELQRAYSLPEPHAGTWCGVPLAHRHPYYYCAVLCEK